MEATSAALVRPQYICVGLAVDQSDYWSTILFRSGHLQDEQDYHLLMSVLNLRTARSFSKRRLQPSKKPGGMFGVSGYDARIRHHYANRQSIAR